MDVVASAIILPIRGKVVAGSPVQPIKSEQVLNLTNILLGTNRFVLQVIGDSMSGDNICNGDYIICEHREAIQSGDIIIAVIDGKATLKRIQFNGDKTVTLIPSNPGMSSHTYPEDRVRIEGVYLGLIRLPAGVLS